ncbi:MAG: DUF2937 family protein [Pseudomonadota bacterium]
MGILSKSWTLGLIVTGVVIFGQAPEFSQQYKQRLGGGINELASVVSQFEKDAASQGLTRAQALDQQNNSNEAFNQLRGKSMESHIKRYENLLMQRQAMQTASPVMQPVHLLRRADVEILSDTLAAYKPGLQLTFEGTLWALVGGGIVGGLGRAPVSAMRFRAKRRRAPKVSYGEDMPSQDEHL